MANKKTNGSGDTFGAAKSFSVGGRSYDITDHTFDVVVVGAGGAGLRAVVGSTGVWLSPRLSRSAIASLSLRFSSTARILIARIKSSGRSSVVFTCP